MEQGMTKNKSILENAGELRRQAEERFGAHQTGVVADKPNTPAETQRLLHELQVHQIELEMQNEELQRARSEVEEGLSRYTALYEFAPVGYLTLNQQGEIQQVNLTGSRLFGLERSHLMGKRLSIMVDVDSRPAFNAFLAKVFENGGRQTCEVVVRPELASPFAVEFAATAAAASKECRVVATDITARKRSEALMAVRLRLQEFASSHSPKELIQKMLDELEAVTGSRVGYFHYLEADEHTPSLQVWSTRTVGALGVTHESPPHDDVDQQGIWADCVRKRSPIIHNDKPPNRKGSPDGYVPMIREVVVPIFRKDKIVAILGMGNKDAGYTTSDVSTISFLV
jgi:PAS domain S-box-containing protein